MKPVDFVQYKHFNERDIEAPVTLQAVKIALDNGAGSILDVGAHYSAHTYATDIRRLLTEQDYNGVDIIDPDTETLECLDNYYIGNVKDLEIDNADIVLCISALEHSGISTYTTDDYVKERISVARRLLSLANCTLFMTFPYGKEKLFAPHYANVTYEHLDKFYGIAETLGFTEIIEDFYYNKFPQEKKEWYKIDKEEASAIPLDKTKGTQCVAAVTIKRRY